MCKNDTGALLLIILNTENEIKKERKKERERERYIYRERECKKEGKKWKQDRYKVSVKDGCRGFRTDK